MKILLTDEDRGELARLLTGDFHCRTLDKNVWRQAGFDWLTKVMGLTPDEAKTEVETAWKELYP